MPDPLPPTAGDTVLFPPNGVDRADGSHTDEAGNVIGTADVAGSVLINPGGAGEDTEDFIFEELPDSPEIERAEQGTIQHRFRCDPETGLVLIKQLPRGRWLTDTAGNITRVVSSRLNWQKPNVPILTVTAEGVSFDTPPDEFSLQVIELNPAIEKHPRYAFLSVMLRNFVNSAVSGAQLLTQTQAEQFIRDGLTPDFLHPPPPAEPPQPIGTDKQIIDACIELLNKRRIGEDTFYLPGFRIVWSRYYWGPPLLNPGGYIGDPIMEGLPYFFWSVDRTPEGSDIFSKMAEINPQFYTRGDDFDPELYRDGISWLRQSDTMDYSRTWFKVTHTWIGAPYAHWDADIYSQNLSPYPLPPPLPISGG
jgi:hypothetical protein